MLNMTYINGNTTIQSHTVDAFARYIAHDNRVRNYHIIDYTVNGDFNPHAYFDAQNQIHGQYTTLDVLTTTTSTAQEEFDLDASIVLDIVENVLDAVKSGKDIVEQFMKKIIGFVQGKVIDGAVKELLAKITKKALKSAVKAILSITTVKGYIVKGIRILEKLGVTIPSWLKKALDFVESIPFIDPPVEMWKIRLTFINETTDTPMLGYDYINNVTIDSHPQGLYFGDTYSAQVILSSRDIFPLVGRIQSANGSKTLTGHLYVEDFALQQADHARSSLEPGEYAQGRIYATQPGDSPIISQCHITPESTLSSPVEIGTVYNVTLSVKDENGTLLSNPNRARAAINNLPSTMVELSVSADASGYMTFEINTGEIGVRPDDHMIAAIYKPTNMFHDYWNYTFVLQDTVAPAITNVTCAIDYDDGKIDFSALVSDYDLNTTSVVLKIIDGSTDLNLAESYGMTFNGSHYVVSANLASFASDTVYFLVTAEDNSGNAGQSTLDSLALTKTAVSPPTPMVVYLAAGVAGLVVVALVVYAIRRPH